MSGLPKFFFNFGDTEILKINLGFRQKIQQKISVIVTFFMVLENYKDFRQFYKEIVKNTIYNINKIIIWYPQVKKK